MQGGIVFVEPQVEHIEFKFGQFFPEPTALRAVPGVSPGRGSPTPHGCLHPGKCEHRSQKYGGLSGVERAKIKKYILSFKRMIRFDLNMEHDEVYGKFVLTVCICSFL